LVSNDYLGDPRELVESLVPETSLHMGNLYVLARELAYKYIDESSSLSELIDKINIAKDAEQNKTAKDALSYLALKAEEVSRKRDFVSP
jgi:hypothetical protein